MKTIPTYSLYGVSSSEPLLDQLHFESIAARSQLYSWEIKPHKHEHFLQILYLHTGVGEALLEDGYQRLASGSLITMPPRHIHGFVFSPETDGVVVTLTESYLRSLLGGVPEVLPWLQSPRHDQVVHPHPLAGTLDLFRQETESLSTWRGATLSALLTLVLVGIARLAESTGGVTARLSSRPRRHLQHFQQLLESDYRSQKEIAYYACKIGVTSTQLNRICRQLAGRSALQMLHTRIMVEAQRDLLFSDLSVKHIAMTLGFTDANYFSRFFSRISGQTPTAFRERGRGIMPEFSRPER